MSDLAAGANEDLEDGARDATPDGDNLVLDYVRAEAAAYAALAVAGGGRSTTFGALGLHLADLAVATPFGNTAHLTRPLTHDRVDAVTTALHAYFAIERGGPFLVFSSWPTPDLSEHGFTRVGHPPLMFRSPTPPPPPLPHVEIARVTDDDGLAAFEQTLIEAYPVEEMQPWVRGSLLGSGILETSWHLYVARIDGRVVATAGAWVTDRLVIVELVSTRPEARGTGVGRAVTAAAGAAGADRPAMLIASDLGRGVYEGLGYRSLLRETLWIGHRGGPR